MAMTITAPTVAPAVRTVPSATDALVGGGERTATALALATVLLIVSSAMKFRARSADLALQGDADHQVLLELGAYALVGGWILLRRVLAEMSPRPVARRLSARSPLRLMRLFAVAALVSSAWSPTTISTVRAVQYVIAVELTAEIVYVCRGRTRLAERFWVVFSVATTAMIAVALVLTIAPGSGFTAWWPTYQGVDRFRLLAMHPIATADLLGLGLVCVCEPLFRRSILGGRGGLGAPSWRLARLAVVGLLGAMILLTRERTSTAACIIAVGCLAMCLRDRGRVQVRALLALVLGAAAFLLFSEQLVALLLRGQSTSDLAGLSGRNQILTAAWELFRQHPLVGQGYLTGRSAFLPTIPWAGESHNGLVEVVISFGVLGVLLFVAVLIRWYQLTRRGRRSLSDDRRIFAVRSVALVALVVVVGLAADSFAGPPGLAVLVFLLGLAFAELAAGPADLPEVG